MTFLARSQPHASSIQQAESHHLELDLETLEGLPRYHDWIIEQFAPYLEGHVAEVGPGLGTISERLLPRVGSLDLIEPDSKMVTRLQSKFDGNSKVRVIPSPVEEFLETGAAASYDGIVMVNVLEHIEDDYAALKGLHTMLKPGGKLMLYVPALPFLYSELDRFYGHYRRYTRRELVEKAVDADLRIITARYIDFIGILPWWLMNTLMGKTDFNYRAIRIYDSLLVPISRLAEKIISPPLGKNVFLIAERPVDDS